MTAFWILFAFCVAMVPKPRFDRAVAKFVRSDKLLALTSFSLRLVVTVEEKLASSLIAAASSFSVSSAPGLSR